MRDHCFFLVFLLQNPGALEQLERDFSEADTLDAVDFTTTLATLRCLSAPESMLAKMFSGQYIPQTISLQAEGVPTGEKAALSPPKEKGQPRGYPEPALADVSSAANLAKQLSAQQCPHSSANRRCCDPYGSRQMPDRKPPTTQADDDLRDS